MDWKKINAEFKPGEVVTVTFKKANGSTYCQSSALLYKIDPENEDPIQLVQEGRRFGFPKSSINELEEMGGSIELSHGDITKTPQHNYDYDYVDVEK